MNILVCIKQVPGTNKVQVDPDTGVLLRQGVDSKTNPYDLFALETALTLKQQYGGKVTVLSMGPPQAEAAIREAFAMGADCGVLLSDRRFAGADVLATSFTLSQGVRALGGFDLIICGKQTTDGDTAQVGPALSEWLELPALSGVRRIDAVEHGHITVEVDLQTHVQLCRLPLPCLISVEKDIYAPRLPSYLKKTASKDWPVRVLTLDDLTDTDEGGYGLKGSPTKVQQIFPPTSDVSHEIRQGDAELGDFLYEWLTDRKII